MIKSVPGVIVSSLLILIMLAYAVTKFDGLITRQDPQITVTEMKQFYDSTQVINFRKTEFKVAFAVESYDDSRTGKDDPNYVRWVVQLTRMMGQVETVFPLKFHKCTDADYDSFYEPAASF